MMRQMVLLYACIYICLTINGICAVTVPLHTNNDQDDTREAMRLAKSAEMRSYMLPNVDACDDFYQYACGNWRKIHPATLSDAKTGHFHMRKQQYNQRVAQILRESKDATAAAAVATASPATEEKLKDFFQSCLSHTALRHDYRARLLSVLDAYGGMPALKGDSWQEHEFDWLQVIALILRKYGKQIIIGAKIFSDLHNNTLSRLYLGQLDELQPPRATNYYAAMRWVRRVELEQVLGLSTTQAKKIANELIEFTLDLAAGMVDPQAGLYMKDKSQLSTLDAMTKRYEPTLNFTRFVDVWLAQPYHEPVYIYVDAYLRNVERVMARTPKRIVANYIMWELLQLIHLEPADDEEAQLQKCIELTKDHFVKYLDQLVYQQLRQQNEPLDNGLYELWRTLKATFARWLETQVPWLTASTRKQALAKLAAMTLEVSNYASENFTQLYADLVVSKHDYFENVLNVLQLRGRQYRARLFAPAQLEDSELLNFSPAYEPEYNKVLISVAYLQPPQQWHENYPAALRYGNIGYTIAHEMLHGFDDISRWYDAAGNLNNWWDRNSSAAFTTRKTCFKQQYSRIPYYGQPLPAVDEQDENIADNGAVRVAYAAYEQWLMTALNTTLEESLPQMEHTPRQLYFLSVAQVWCADVHSYFRSILTETETHAPEQLRVRAMMSNSADFAREFKCATGSKMHPESKCVLY